MNTLTHADHARVGERLYMSAEWGCDACQHCAESWLPTRWDRSRGWICRGCDEKIDGYGGEKRRKEDR